MMGGFLMRWKGPETGLWLLMMVFLRCHICQNTKQKKRAVSHTGSFSGTGQYEQKTLLQVTQVKTPFPFAHPHTILHDPVLKVSLIM
jgi:hypothetical protein